MFKFRQIFTLIAFLVSLLSLPQAWAVINVSNESELTTALSQTADLDINITTNITLSSPIVVPASGYRFTGNGFNITTTGGGISFPAGVSVKNLRVDAGLALFLNNSATVGGGLSRAYTVILRR
jgi:hypothetical protein